MRAYGRLHRLTREDRGSDRRVEQRTETLRTRKLAGHDDYRIRVGDYRIVYAVDDENRLVIVARIAHRREVYRR
jgi:mRNA-degrading endonuclease RelE of RelBE toxin-antitoxin system